MIRAAGTLKQCAAALNEQRTSINTWKFGCDLIARESELTRFVDNYVASVKLLMDFRSCLADLDKEAQEEQADTESKAVRDQPRLLHAGSKEHRNLNKLSRCILSMSFFSYCICSFVWSLELDVFIRFASVLFLLQNTDLFSGTQHNFKPH